MVAVTSGANMNFDRLRLVSELAQVGARREAMLATSIPEVTSRRASANFVRHDAQHLRGRLPVLCKRQVHAHPCCCF